MTGGYTDHYTNRARVLIILFDDRLAALQIVGYITYKSDIDNSNKILHWAAHHMVSRLLFQLALVIVIQCFAAQTASKSDNTSVQPAFNLSTNFQAGSTTSSAWDSLESGIFKSLNQMLIELQVNVFWYKDFIVFDYFEFIY